MTRDRRLFLYFLFVWKSSCCFSRMCCCFCCCCHCFCFYCFISFSQTYFFILGIKHAFWNTYNFKVTLELKWNHKTISNSSNNVRTLFCSTVNFLCSMCTSNCLLFSRRVPNNCSKSVTCSEMVALVPKRSI